ncbi:uncharacterized protein si:ch211-260e23.9 [Syngnathoides biaculeatus]|uniref:uncharacterized protein si:ch211-260e23.9 n=1 Tax=Syngnathoides biaculeatus TaxID=300417 RepID=UPI002ADE6499|nr:uncharacterized protein si:ch211-260e23.9 [Syngnathoides biaculeatus]
MFGKLISQLFGGGGAEDECEEGGDAAERALEWEDGGWVVVSLPGAGPLLTQEGADPPEDPLTPRPDAAVYRARRRMSGGADEEDEGSDEDEQNASSRPVTSSSPRAAPRRRLSWRLAAWGVLLPADGLPTPTAERKKLSRGALLRQNLTAKTRRSPPAERRVKQPNRRQYNY